MTGYLQEEAAWQEIRDWVDAAGVVAAMRENRVGVLGHYYCGMLDVYSDLTQQTVVFGNHFQLLEMCELSELRKTTTEKEVASKTAEFLETFDVDPACEPAEIERAARTSVALDKLVEKHNLGSMAYYYEGTGEYENIVTSVIAGNTLLAGRHIPVAGECEVKNAQDPTGPAMTPCPTRWVRQLDWSLDCPPIRRPSGPAVDWNGHSGKRAPLCPPAEVAGNRIGIRPQRTRAVREPDGAPRPAARPVPSKGLEPRSSASRVGLPCPLEPAAGR